MPGVYKVEIDHLCPTTQAWLDMHHGAAATQAGTASGYSSVIQQALILDMQSASFNALNIEAIGWNGQMPQLDLYFLVKRLAEIGSGLQFTQVSPSHCNCKLLHCCLHIHSYSST